MGAYYEQIIPLSIAPKRAQLFTLKSSKKKFWYIRILKKEKSGYFQKSLRTDVYDVAVSKASLLFSFFLSVSGSVLYYLESQGLNNFFSNYFLLSHKYYTLLFINTAILFLSSCSVFILKKK